MPRGDATGPWWAQSGEFPGRGHCRGFGARGMKRGARRGRALGQGPRAAIDSTEPTNSPRSLSIEERLARLEAHFERMNALADAPDTSSDTPQPDNDPEKGPTSHE